MRHVQTIFFDWNLPLLPAITERLLSGAQSDFIDLSNILVVVPTVQSGRRLREALALASKGLFPPEIVTPDGLLLQTIRDEPVASETAIIAAWVSILQSIDFKQFNTLFPVAPDPSIEWQHSMARRFAKLRNELGEEGLDFQQVARFTEKGGQEPERWQELARLEMLYLDCLEAYNLRDPKQLRREAAQNYKPSEQIERIILAATPDPQPLILQALERAAQKIPVEIWIYGAEDAQFDKWGRPVVEYWSQRSLHFETWGVHLQPVTSPKTAADFIVESMQGKAPESILLGLADSTLNPIVADALTRAEIAHYDPEGQPLRNGTIGQLTELLCRLRKDPGTSTVRTLLQHPDMQDWLGVTDHANKVLRQLDQIFENHLAPDLYALVNVAAKSTKATELKGALKQLKTLADELSATDLFAETLAKKLQLIYAEKQVEHAVESTVPWEERAEAIRKWLQFIAEAERLFPNLPKSFAQAALEHSIRNSRVYPTRPPQAHDLLGWLELLWNDAPHLIVAGLNEHSVPESVTGDSFLPESLREQIGLRTTAQRFARDAYLLEALCRRRAGKKGHIDFLIPQVSHDQNPLKPSRLLFQVTADKLIQRTRKLFKATGDGSVSGRQHTAWKLKPPPDLKLPVSLPVSALKSYLQCPFRFFLKHVLRMRPVDVETQELSPAAFGTLFHNTVAKLKGDTLDQTVKPGDLIKKLHAIAEHMFEHRYGNHLSFALRLQHEALMERIVSFAEHQCEDIIQNGGSHILNTEETFDISLEGFVLNGRIDRVDQCGNRLELMDYKTSNHPSDPEKAHLFSASQKTLPAHLPEEALLEQNGKCYCWADLQLPLYKHAKDKDCEKAISLAYFNIGQTIDKSGIVRWETFTQELQDSAIACTIAILRQIKSGIFWPPNQNYNETYDEFRHLFPDGIENSVDAETFANYQFGHSS
jgi:ATP-dependent helicase/nuclease subunit B